MYIQQNQSILFFPKRNKRNQKTCKVHIYARLKIDGLVSDRAILKYFSTEAIQYA